MVAARSIERRIFIVGVPRSGTTLVQSLLAAHSETTSFTESHFFDRHFALLPFGLGPVLVRDPAPSVQAFMIENDEQPCDVSDWFAGRRRWSHGFGLGRPFQTRAVARRLIDLLDQLALRRQRSIWIEKTPRHLRYTPFLDVICSDPRPSVVHVVRDGLEVVASLNQASESWERHYDLDTCVNRWNSDVEFSLSRITAPKNHIVFYEELTADPEATLERLFEELDLSWQPGILERFAQASEQLITSQECWKAGVGRAIRRSGTPDRLSPEQRERVSELLDQNLYDRLYEAVR
jgi:hypothetical protein